MSYTWNFHSFRKTIASAAESSSGIKLSAMILNPEILRVAIEIRAG
jgi:hypothetical protein